MNEVFKQAGFEMYDVTLRDGAQDPRFRSSVRKKLEIAQLLADFGIKKIEGGWPGANKIDTKFFKEAQSVLSLNGAELVAFGMTTKNTAAEEDAGLRRLLSSGTRIVTLVGKTWEQNIKRAVRISGEKNLNNIYESIRFLKEEGREVFFDAEHWFDSYRQNPNYAFRALEAAAQGGASRLVLCDTRGAATDKFIFEATSAAVARIPQAEFGIHIHQDSELAVAGSMRALEAGVVQVQGTVNGYGERTGNLNWCSFLPTAEFGYRLKTGLDLTKLTPFANAIAKITGIPIPSNARYVGYYAFAHKAGLHASAQQRDPEAYELISPESVGNKRVFVFSEQGGSAHLEFMLKKHGYELNRKDPQFKELLEKMKDRPCFGQAQEILFLHENLNGLLRPFSLLEGTGVVDISPAPPEAQVNVRVNGDVHSKKAIGDGPINAFDIALKKALSAKYPEVKDIRLKPEGYSINLSNGDTTTASEVEVCVVVEFRGKEITSIIRGTNQNRAGEESLGDVYNCCILEVRREKE